MSDTGKPPAATSSEATDDPIVGKPKASSPARASPSRTIRETVHTSVLGRDADDSEHFRPPQKKSPTAPYRPIQTPPRTSNTSYPEENNSLPMESSSNAIDAPNHNNRWWGSRLFGGGGGAPIEKNRYSAESNVYRKRRSGNARYDGLHQNAQYDPPPPLSSSTVASSSNDSEGATFSVATKEDQVRENCSYFYQGMEESSSSVLVDSASPFHKTKTHRSSGRTAAAANSLLRRMSIRARLSGEVDGALFMSKYERLNQVLDSPPNRKRRAKHIRGQRYTGNDNSAAGVPPGVENATHDLFLDEDDTSSYREHIPSPTNNVVMTAATLRNGVRSSMFFEQDGKMLMRLPRDQVRLVMDYNLEPGILSVEQWRSRDEAEATTAKLMTLQQESQQESPAEAKARRRKKERQRFLRQYKRERKRRRDKRRRRELEKGIQEEKTGGDGNQTSGIESNSSEYLQNVDLEDPLMTEGGGQLSPAEMAALKQTPSSQKTDGTDNFSIDSEVSSEFSGNGSDSSLGSDDEDSYIEYDMEMQDVLPELKYVITVPDDLYRRMVREMSAKAFPPYWGFFKCCNQESERADIRLALVILAFVMLLLFAGSLEWRTT